ncbi:putative uncharacterized protein [Rhodococcus sp. AW25M09]|uniref:hypothetical protein n=1 Tax=Rhodococcus sp. AW25M09 TaxID=1268303 RepID=UPI0002ABE595|nr:putative uncharacterized protein [Rhodococcus sp. AW25M09]
MSSFRTIKPSLGAHGQMSQDFTDNALMLASAVDAWATSRGGLTPLNSARSPADIRDPKAPIRHEPLTEGAAPIIRSNERHVVDVPKARAEAAVLGLVSVASVPRWRSTTSGRNALLPTSSTPNRTCPRYWVYRRRL